MKHDYKVQTVLERGVYVRLESGGGESAWVRTRVEICLFFFFFFLFFFFFYWRKMQGLYVWVCVSVLFPRIEPVGKPFREVCLQTLLWPWKVHKPSSWSLYLSELALKLKEFFSLFFKWLFWVVLNILSTNELKKIYKKSWVFMGFDPGSSESGVRRSTNWATRAKLTGQ